MNIAILHYHLNRGGVTRVIANQLLALDSALGGSDRCRVAILYGGRAEGWPKDFALQLKCIDLTLCEVRGLDYDSEPVDKSAELTARLREQLRRLEFAPNETVLHVHNHSLGKNTSVADSLINLASDGFSLLLQIHDFAEDFRPHNFRLLSDALDPDNLPAHLYPQASQIHYAALNHRDQAILDLAGVANGRLHWLPNPIPDLGDLPDRRQARAKLRRMCEIPADHRYVLYPVRGIRRKNVGEVLLWSILADEQTEFGMTLAPLNPVEQIHYQKWRELASKQNLRCHFETGRDGGMAFEENLAATDLIMTTSVAEGFGMVFLESFLAARPLIGRDLPEITVDFQDAGIRFESLYQRLNVPLDWIGRDDFASVVEQAYSRVLSSYGRAPLDQATFDERLQAKVEDDLVDFADLSEPLQERVILRACEDAASRNDLHRLNPMVARSLSADLADREMEIRHNTRIIHEQYSLQPSGLRLRALYQAVATSPRSGAIAPPPNGNAILGSFLDLSRFRLIRG